MGEVTRMEMEFLYFETWGNEACSLEQLCFSTRYLFRCVWNLWMCFKMSLDCSFCINFSNFIL